MSSFGTVVNGFPDQTLGRGIGNKYSFTLAIFIGYPLYLNIFLYISTQ